MTRERTGMWIGVIAGGVVGTVVTGMWMEARGWRGEMERRVVALEAGSAVVVGQGGGEAPPVEEATASVLAAAGSGEAPMGCGTSGAVLPTSAMPGAADGAVSAVDWLVAAQGG